jgi:NAD(P)H-dependent flavin oxidoreductase YrpB (nitropropane dioxygenase family)
MLPTAFTRLVGCRDPIQLAPMGQIATVDLAIAVANAGGLGMVGRSLEPRPVLEAAFEEIARRAGGPVGMGFLAPFLDLECLALAARRARVVELFYAAPDPKLVEAVHEGGALASWQVGSVEEARDAVEAGCDLLTVQGCEAGGHVRGTVSLLPLLSSVLDAVDVPVVAAGGIGTARAAAAAFAAGASAVRLGTRFIAARESPAHPAYVDALVAARPEDTVLTGAFHVMWPDAPHRVLRSCVEAAARLEAEIAGEVEIGGQRIAVPRFGVPCPTRAASGHVEAMALYAGESVGAVRGVLPAAEIVREIADGAERLLGGPAAP